MSSQEPAKTRTPRGPLWTREETMIAFNLYSKMQFGQIHYYHPDINHLATLLGRPPSSVAMKMCNLASLDPQHIDRIKGLRIAKVEREVWQEFHANPGKFMLETEELSMALLDQQPEGMVLRDQQPEELPLDPEVANLPKGETRSRLVNARLNQSLFRKIVLTAYHNKCCMTGIATPELLNASHIIPWKDNPEARINPHNGLCLNALHDRAFDRGLISVTPDLIIQVSPKLQNAEIAPDKLDFLLSSAGKPIEKPARFPPNPEFLDHHYRNIFQR